MTKGVNLHRLQGLDSEGDRKRRRLAEIEAALSESDALRQARRAVERVQEHVRELMVKQRDSELEVQGLADKISHDEQRLYSGAIKNPKELADLKAEVAGLKRRRQQVGGDL